MVELLDSRNVASTGRLAKSLSEEETRGSPWTLSRSSHSLHRQVRLPYGKAK